MQISIPRAASASSAAELPLHTSVLSARDKNKNRLADICNLVREAAKKEREHEAITTAAIRSLEGLRSDLLSYQNETPIKKTQLTKRNFVIIETLKFSAVALAALLAVALVILNLYDAITDKGQRATSIANAAASAALSVGLVFIAFSQGALDLHGRIREFKSYKEQEEEQSFVKNMEMLIQNLEWLLMNYQTNPVACHKYIGNCVTCLKKLPIDFIEHNEDIRLLITNLISLLPEDDALRRTLTKMGSQDEVAASVPPGNKVHLKQGSVLRISNADSTSFDQPSLTKFDRLSNLKPEDIIPQPPVITPWLIFPEDNIQTMSELMGVELDEQTVDRLILNSPRGRALNMSAIISRAAEAAYPESAETPNPLVQHAINVLPQPDL